MPRRAIIRGGAALFVILAAGLLAPFTVRDVPHRNVLAAPAVASPSNDHWENQFRWEQNWETGRDTFPVDVTTTNVEATLQAGPS